MLGKTTLCLWLVALCLSATAAQDDDKKLVTEGGVVVLNSKNFDTALKLYDVMLVEFYAPWCGFCKQLKPEYEASALELATEDFPITLAKCDVIKEEKLGERFKVESFPTLKVFLKHEPEAIKWEGDPSKKNVLEKMRSYRKETEFKPPLKEVADVASAKKFAKGFANVLGVFASSDDPEYKAFAKASVFQAHREFVKFGVTTSADVAQHFGVEAPAVLVLKQFDDPQETAPSDVLADTKALEKWVQSTTRPLVCPLTDTKTDCGLLSPMYTIFVPTETVDKGAEYLDFKKVARDSRAAGHDIHFGFMGSEHQATEKFFELFPEEMPTVAGLVRGGMFKGGAVKFHIDKNEWEDMTYDSMTQIRDLFLKSTVFDHANGLEPSLSSSDPEDIPEGSSLKNMVSTEWNSMVMQQDKQDVLIEFFAPWCSMCKAILPFYEELANVFADVPTVLIAKLDATSNEVYEKNVRLEGYPTIFFIPAKTKKVVVFDKWSNKDVDEMQKWVIEKASIPVDKDLLRKAKVVEEAKVEGEEQKTKAEAGLSQPFAEGQDANDAVKTLTLGNFKDRVLDDANSWFVDFYTPWCGHCKTLAPKFKDTAELYAKAGGSEVSFGKCDPSNNDIPSVLPGLSVTSFPSIYFFNKDSPMEPVEYKGPKYKEEMLEFVQGGYKTAAVTQLKSADAIDDSKLPVKVLVGSTFKERVLDSGKNSLMEFYAPWCGHCKALAPKLDTVAEKMEGSFFIGKMDLTANELPKKYAGLVSGYPTLLYFPHDDPKNPLVYSGPREEKDIIAYLEEQAKADADDADDL
jgi:protein disulfide-isomerase-like protein